METPDEKSVSSSDGYKNVEDRVNNTLNSVRQIDRQIENTPKDAKPAPVPRPPGWYSNRKHSGDRDRTITNLKGEQERLKAEAWEGIEKAARSMDEQTSRIAKDSAREKLFPNPYRRMNLEERAQEHDQPKDIERAQDYMDVQRLDKRAERDATFQPGKPAVEKEEPGIATSSEGWSSSLKYAKFIEQAVELVKEELDRAPDKERD